MTYNCRVCGDELADENWSPSYPKQHKYICKTCDSENNRLYKKNNPEKAKEIWTKASRKAGHLPMSENKECASYFGIHINERLLRHKFNDVEVMPYGNPGYDVICNHGKKIDFKSGCIRKDRNGWLFAIKRNTIADYFLLVAYDNRTDSNPLYMWLIPGNVLNHLMGAGINLSTIHKWDEYLQPIDELITCCDTIRGE